MASVQEYFEGLAARVPADRIAGMTNTYVFDIEGAGAWTVAIADGAIVVTEGIGDADCTFSATEESFAKIVAGEQNPTTAYMTGKLKIKGDMGAAMKLQKIFLTDASLEPEGASMILLVRFLVIWGINVLALIVVDWMFGGVEIELWGSLLLGAFVLTIGNTILKPILAILTLPLILVTFGLAYFALNVLMLALAEWIAPDFSISGFWTYIGATIVVWLVNVAVGWLLDRVRGD